jgi:ubiquinone/menaquinone biosynthesis C-methylase UbiE
LAVKRGTGPRQEREAAFFDALTTSASVSLPGTAGATDTATVAADGNLGAMLSWLGDLRGKRVLDLCCGTGITSLLLAEAGAKVVGCDVSESSLDVARGRAGAVDPDDRPSFVRHDVQVRRPDWEGRFDVLFGSYALHHLDLDLCLPLLASYLRPGGRSIFLETSARNPLLRWSRRWLAGRLGVARYGTIDERPLTRADIQAISCRLGGCQIIPAEYAFLRILDRQIFRYRWPRFSGACARGDGLLRRAYPAGSYHIVLACGPFAASAPEPSLLAAGGPPARGAGSGDR